MNPRQDNFATLCGSVVSSLRRTICTSHSSTRSRLGLLRSLALDTFSLSSPRKRGSSRVCFVILVLLPCFFRTSYADDLQNEDILFGGNAQPASNAEAISDAPESQNLASEEAPDDPLQIGGLFYQRFIVSGQEGVSMKDTPIAAPLQLDFFLDARLGDRLRGFVKPRLLFDSARDAYGNTTSGTTFENLLLGGSSATLETDNPQTVLGEAWLKFDIEHVVFATIGKQHVKWGTARFWNPTDFLSSQKKDPLATSDLRLGSTMAKFEIPVEKMGTNFYVIGLFDNPEPASTVGQMGAAFRAEKVVNETEVGADFILRGANNNSLGGDLSSALGPFDVYVEASFLTSAPEPIYQLIAAPTEGADLSTLVSESTPEGNFVQASGGLKFSFAWRDNRLATVGAEYFYNELGYTDAAIYPMLVFLSAFKPFYLGRHYAGLYLTADGFDAQKKTSYGFSTVSNLSDESLISRLDFSWRVLTYLTFEAFADAHAGSIGGEFNFALDTPELTYQGTTLAAVQLPRTILDAGVGLKMSF